MAFFGERDESEAQPERGRTGIQKPMGSVTRLWLGRLDSNQGMAVPKTAALPLGYAPTNQTEAIGWAAL